MNPISRQDVQNIVDISRNRIMERMVTKQDVAMVAEAMKNVLATCQQSQQLLRQSEYQRVELSRRVATLEARLSHFEQEMRVLNTAVLKTVERGQVALPMQSASDEDGRRQAVQHTYYRPA